MAVSVTDRVNERLTFSANYTLSKAIDDVTDYNSDFQANDQTNLSLERALSSFDERHKIVAYANIEPGRFLRNFTISPLLQAHSARPFNLLTGTDLNGDRHSTTDRPAFAGRNTGIGPDFFSFDIRVARKIQIDESRRLELMLEGFNLFNRVNYGSVNNTVGPNFAGPFHVQARNDIGPSQPLAYTSALNSRRIQLGIRFGF